MSVFRLEAAPYTKVDSRYIESVDLTVSNIGAEPYEMLIHGYKPEGVFHVGLIHVPVGAVMSIPGLMTQYSSFGLLLVTNYHTFHTTGITAHVKNHGAVVAVFTQEDFTRMH
ncbi:hypothetical protein DNH61_21735 [Paenibacillus sambharensis]|uniref:Uncharacterized protein n=1 Tax=Paenibacillus sambharensis TaxID=1803190 RepID=A0A2W1LN89_9BACL|nr:hypothetical protein [Paenibacillus sambharensis]PZD93271.1 hypothetical protein DNH61_21735 [Paenibacillus sambharensis]